MKKSLSYFLIIGIFSFFTNNAKAQVKEIWKKELSSALLWQQVNTMGNFLVCTNSELASYNPQTGVKIWGISQFAGIREYQISELSGSPLISITMGDEISLVDPFSGKIKFNSKSAGVSKISTQQVLYLSNGIIIAGESDKNHPIILMIDISSGNIVWKIEEKFGRIININELSEKEFLMVTLFNNYKIDSKTGKIIWKNSISKEVDQLEGMGALGSLMKEVAVKATANEDFKVNFYKHPQKEIFIVGVENKEETASSNGQPVVKYANTYSAFNISDGSRLWSKALEENGLLSDFTFYKDGFIVLPDNGARTSINYYDLNTLEGKWGKKGKGIFVKGGIYHHVKTESGILLVSRSNDKNFLSFLDPDQGIITYDKPVKVNGEVVFTNKTPKGILFVTTNEVNILNPVTGELLLGQSVITNPNLFIQKENKCYVYDFQDGFIKEINLDQETIKKVSSTAITFDGKERPAKIELRENGFFISSEQNVALISFEGNLVFNKYYEAPREEGLKKALLYAQAARAAYISANSYYAAGVLQSAATEIKQEDQVAGAMLGGIGMAYEELGNQASDFAKQSFQQANARFKATAEGRDFIIILSKIEKNNALLKINKNSGEIDGSINLGSEKEPRYAVDDVTGQIFKQSNTNEITSYKF